MAKQDTAVDSTVNAREALLTALDRQRTAFQKERHVEYATRINRLDRCLKLIAENREAICAAVNEDFGTRHSTLTKMTDLFTSVGSLKHAKKKLKKWMKPEKRSAPIPMNFMGAKAKVMYQPKGVVGVMTPWNVPVNMIFSPLADIIAAGNRAMIKPSEFTPKTAELMKTLFAQYFEPSEILVVTGGPEVGAAFSSLPFDHLIFTGATSIGKLVMQAAAENLVPVTLELGGKSPVIVSDSTLPAEAAESIITGKAMNAGQLCVSPDYCFVPASRLQAFVTACKETIAEQFPTVVNNNDYCAMINERHFERVKAYIEEARESGAEVIALAPQGEDWSDPAKHKIPLHLIINPSDDLKCMQDEIFGPILNIKTYRDIEEPINFVNARPRPLAFYYYGKDKDEESFVLNNTIAGGVSVNAVTMHVSCDDLPFGGVGASGMGNYRGFEGFKTFSHAKAVYKEGWVNLAKLGGTLPPYTEKTANMMNGQIGGD